MNHLNPLGMILVLAAAALAVSCGETRKEPGKVPESTVGAEKPTPAATSASDAGSGPAAAPAVGTTTDVLGTLPAGRTPPPPGYRPRQPKRQATGSDDPQTITDLDNWKHPIRQVFTGLGIQVHRIVLTEQRTYPTFTVTLPAWPDVTAAREAFSRLCRGNAGWNYALVCDRSGIVIRVLCDGSAAVGGEGPGWGAAAGSPATAEGSTPPANPPAVPGVDAVGRVTLPGLHAPIQLGGAEEEALLAIGGTVKRQAMADACVWVADRKACATAHGQWAGTEIVAPGIATGRSSCSLRVRVVDERVLGVGVTCALPSRIAKSPYAVLVEQAKAALGQGKTRKEVMNGSGSRWTTETTWMSARYHVDYTRDGSRDEKSDLDLMSDDSFDVTWDAWQSPGAAVGSR